MSYLKTLGDLNRFMSKTVTVELEFHDCMTEHGDVSLASAPDDLSGLRIGVFPDEWLLEDGDDFKPTGRHQIQLSGTPQSLANLGRYLIAISEQNDLPRDFVTHFDPIPGGANANDVHLIVHQKYTENPQVLQRIGDEIATTEDGED